MAVTVDLMVIGLSGDTSRDELTKKLVKEFRQDAGAFSELIDAAFGDSEPYAAQSDVSPAVAEEGKAQLEKLGVACEVRSYADSDSGILSPPNAPISEPSTDPVFEDLSKSENSVSESSDAISLAGSAVGVASGGIANGIVSKKKSDNADAGVADFSDELAAADNIDDVDAKFGASDKANTDSSAGIASGGIANGIVSKKKSDNGEAAAADFSDELAAVDNIDEVDAKFSDLKDSEPTDNTAPAGSLNASEVLSFDELAAEGQSSKSVEEPSKVDSAKSKSAVPEALASVSFDELSADLIDPAPKAKEKKEDVVLDDGGLSLSDDDSKPLTAAKAKSDPNSADDGGLSLDTDSEIKPSAPEEKAPEALPESLKKDDKPLEEAGSSEKKADALEVTAASLTPELKEDKVEAIEQAVELPKAELPKADLPEEVLKAAKVDELPELKAEEVAADQTNLDVAENKVSAAPKAADKVDTTVTDVQSESKGEPKPEGLVFPGQAVPSFVPSLTPESELGEPNDVPVVAVAASAPSNSANSDTKTARKAAPKSGKVKKIAAALAGVAVLAGGATFALKNSGSLGSSQQLDGAVELGSVQNAQSLVKQVTVVTGDLSKSVDLETLSTEELLVNLSVSSNANTIVGLEPYFLESVDRRRSGPRFGAAIPAESGLMVGVKNRVPHPADQYFDEWSNREDDLLLFVALLDNLIEKGDLDVAQQLADRAKDKLFAVMSNQRLARAYSDVGKNEEVTKLMAMSARDTFAIKGAAERVLAISDYGLTEQAIGLNEDAMDTFLKTSILARSLSKPELQTVGLSSAARYFHRSGREDEAQALVKESLEAGMRLPKTAAARDLAIRYVALTEARMGLFKQALEHIEIIVDPFAVVSAYHGVALAIESTGDDSSARRVLNMAYRAASGIEDQDERSDLLSKVILASESE